MADQVLGVAEPDLTDLELVIVNVQTSDGRQFSFVLAPEERQRMSMTHDVEEGETGSQHMLTVILGENE